MLICVHHFILKVNKDDFKKSAFMNFLWQYLFSRIFKGKGSNVFA